jgi:hypothetical protein
MTKAGAIAILSAIFLGLAGWAGSTLVEQNSRIARIETAKQYDSEMIKEIKDDVKVIKGKLDGIRFIK